MRVQQRTSSTPRVALVDLKLGHLTLLDPESRGYAVADHVVVLPLGVLADGD